MKPNCREALLRLRKVNLMRLRAAREPGNELARKLVRLCEDHLREYDARCYAYRAQWRVL